jgi:hypothetical protein
LGGAGPPPPQPRTANPGYQPLVMPERRRHRKRDFVAARQPPRYECDVPRPLPVRMAAAVLLSCLPSCTSFPPAITGVTVFPAGADGQPRGVSLCRTATQPPIPVIGLRPGSDPRQSSLWLNNPSTGLVRITLARGLQHFVLYCARLDSSDHFVIAVYLDDESTPSLTALADSRLSQSVQPTGAPLVRGLDGALIPNHSAQSVVRDGYRVTLRGVAFPLDGMAVDSLGPWALIPDGIGDLAGVLAVDVQPAPASAGDG